MANSKRSAIVRNGILDQNPLLVMLLGLCPVMVATQSINNAIGMSAAVLLVLFFSNLIVSSINKIIAIPSEIRIPIYIVIIASLVTIVDLLMQAYTPELSASLGVFIPLITVNCIILGRAEAFASKNGILDSILDALGMALGFAAACFVIAFFREFLGTGGWAFDNPFTGANLFTWTPLEDFAMPAMVSGVGGFMIFGIILGIFNFSRIKINENRIRQKAAKIAPKGGK